MESASLEERMNSKEHRLEELCSMFQQLLNCSDQPNIASTSTTPTVLPEQNSSTSTTPATRPQVSTALPERYDGSPDLCQGFLMQYSMFIEHDPEQFLVEIDKIHFVISLPTGKAKAWASALWTQNGAAGNFTDADLVRRWKVPIEAINPPLNLRAVDDRPLGKGRVTERTGLLIMKVGLEVESPALGRHSNPRLASEPHLQQKALNRGAELHRVGRALRQRGFWFQLLRGCYISLSVPPRRLPFCSPHIMVTVSN
ncbi:hypothetical protein AOLI_G00301000 [Acnodon oligacanthus]